MLITFVLLGKYLEASAKGKASQAMSELLSLQPPTALRCEGCWESNEEPIEVHVADLVKGDVIKVLPGATIPSDASVLRGTSTVDESSRLPGFEPWPTLRTLHTFQTFQALQRSRLVGLEPWLPQPLLDPHTQHTRTQHTHARREYDDSGSIAVLQ